MLDRQIFPGHVYNRIYFYSVLEEIVGASGTLFDYDCTNVSQVLISGWIPYGTKRDALQQLLFATNIHAFWDTTNQRVVFDYISHTVAGTIADANIFDSGTVEYPQQATKIIVTEHAFFPYVTGNLVVAFDNSTGYALNGERVKFSNAPIIPSTIVTTGNITLSDITSDSAVVTGRGIVQAYQYTHTTFQTERDANVTDRKEYEVSVTNAYLISVLNSETVADRLADYYFNRFVVKDGIKLNGEECGKFYTLKDAFNVVRTGFLQKMEKVYSSFIKGACEFICGATQDYKGNTFSRYALFYYDESNAVSHPMSGTWTVPSGVTTARVILIGGGTGGSSGLPGNPGDTSGNGGKGGEAGTPGEGGKIYEFTLAVTAGQKYDYVLGVGGAGGSALSYATYQNTHQANAGSAGGDTTFQKQGGGTQYSSASGIASSVGWFCMANSTVMAKPGGQGSKGGDGGNAGSNSDVASDTTKRAGTAGESVSWNSQTFAGGAGGAGTFVVAPTSFARVSSMTAAQIVSAGVYVLQNGTKTLQTPQTDFANGMKNLATVGTNYCNAYGWKYQMGISGGGGGGAALGVAGTAGAAGANNSTYPGVMCLDMDNPLQEGNTYCWHEIDTTKGGNGGNGAAAGGFTRHLLPGKGGDAGWGGGGGGGCAASRSGTNSIQWLLVEYKENATAPTPGNGGNGGVGQQGSYGGIVIYMT